MYMKVNDEKVLIIYCKFGRGKVTVNKRFEISKEGVKDLKTKKVYKELQLHREYYTLPTDFEKVEIILENM